MTSVSLVYKRNHKENTVININELKLNIVRASLLVRP